MSRRYIIDSFKKEDVKYDNSSPSLIKQAQDYIDYITKNMHKFRKIGLFADQCVISHLEILKDTYNNIGTNLLRKLFERGGVVFPSWLKDTIDDIEQIKSGVSSAYNASEYGESFKAEIFAVIKRGDFLFC